MDADNLPITINRAPTGEVHKTLPGYDADYREKLDALHKRISELEEQLESAKKERSALLETAVPIQRPLSPLLRLPQDVIREIFLACIDPETNPTMSKKEAPTLVTQICSGLRRIALASPELWAAIHIPIFDSMPESISDYAQCSVNKQADGVKEWLLRRSGNLPLRISIRRSHDIFIAGQGCVTLTSDIMDVVFSCCTRWRDVFFAVGYGALLPRFAQLRPEDVPFLQSFYHTPGIDRELVLSSQEKETFWPSCRFLAGPNLRKFCVDATIYAKDISKLLLSIPIIWGNLTNLGLLRTNLGSDEFVTLCSMLRQCPRLISLKLHCVTLASPSMSVGTVVLPALQYLEIQKFQYGWGLLDAPGILALISAPALTTFVYNKEGDIAEGPKHLSALLKWAPNLTHLTIGVCPANMLLECLQHCPRLVYLGLDKLSSGQTRWPWDTCSTNWVDQFFSRLFLDNDCLCPHLDHFGASNIFTPSLETIQSIVHRKNGTVPHLARWKALQLCICYDSQDRDEIEKLRAEVNADGHKQVDIYFCEAFQIVREVANNIGHHTQLHARRDPCFPEDKHGAKNTWRPWKYTWPSSDAWPLGESL